MLQRIHRATQPLLEEKVEKIMLGVWGITVGSLFACLLIICLAAQLGRCDEIAARNSPMLKELENLKLMVEGLNKNQQRIINQIGEVCNHQTAPLPDIGQILEEKLWQFDADRTGMADFALESAGAEIIPEHTSQGRKSNYQKMSPRIAITPGALPGTCFAFEGGSGTLGIKLSQPIVVQNVTLQHIPKILDAMVHFSPLGHIESAPRSFELFSISGRYEESLGVFEFSDTGKPIQTFVVKENALVSVAVKFKFNSNWGAAHTCIYRTRVHGSLSHNLV